jgi:hypothetical protein
MQFHLESDERKLLAEILLEEEVGKYTELLNKVLDRNFRFDVDELEQTAVLLVNKKRRLEDQIARQPDLSLKTELQRQLQLLERVQERVNEACVMF